MRMIRIRIAAPIRTAEFLPSSALRRANANHSHLDSHPQPRPRTDHSNKRVFERSFFLAKRGEASDLRGEASQKVLRFL